MVFVILLLMKLHYPFLSNIINRTEIKTRKSHVCQTQTLPRITHQVYRDYVPQHFCARLFTYRKSYLMLQCFSSLYTFATLYSNQEITENKIQTPPQDNSMVQARYPQCFSLSIVIVPDYSFYLLLPFPTRISRIKSHGRAMYVENRAEEPVFVGFPLMWKLEHSCCSEATESLSMIKLFFYLS